VSGLGQGFDAANAMAALGWESRGDGVAVNVVTSANLEGLVKLWQDGQQVATWPVAVGPGRALTDCGQEGVDWGQSECSCSIRRQARHSGG